tara:strand:+ start:514 stop:819 length:306 start_codon:yes stop_codon:yes gene_type:complete
MKVNNTIIPVFNNGASIVDNGWLEYYKMCENNLKELMDILKNKDFQDFYDTTDFGADAGAKELGDHWDKYIIPIHDLAGIHDPEGHYNRGNKRRRGDRELE